MADSILKAFWGFRMKDSPEFATFVGDHRFDDQLEALSLESFAERTETCQKFLERISAVDKSKCTEADLLNLELLKVELDTYVSGDRFHGYLFADNFLEGVRNDFAQTVSYMKFNNAADYEKYILRLQALPRQISEIINLLDTGIAEGRTNHVLSMNGIVDELSKLTTLYGLMESQISAPLKNVLDSLTADQIDDIKTRAKHFLENLVGPAFQNLKDFIEKTYIPACRTEIGISSVPDGLEHYAHCLKFHVSCDITATEVHELGLKEVARIQAQMEALKQQVNFDGTLKQFFDHLRVDPQFYYKTEEDLLNGFKDLVENRIKQKLPLIIRNIPDVKLEIMPTPASMANAPAGFYYAGSSDGSRPGRFYANLHKVGERPKYMMMALTLHEAEPGHHLQGSYAMLEKSLPEFRRFMEDRAYYKAPGRFGMNTAYMEGWGLYSESLGEEMGLYENEPYSLFGRYSMEMFRACRLVVDTGMHVFGWTRDQAVQYILDHTAESEHEANTEIDRYITWPGQACAYKIGELKIRELRQKAKDQLGDLFDILDYHEVILKCGAVPLSVLEQLVDAYILKKMN